MNPKIQPTALAVAATPASIRPPLSKVFGVKELMPLLMRTRNRTRWSPAQRAAFRLYLRRLRSLSPYLIVLALPGSFLMLPALVWWLGQRRNHKRPGAATPQK